MTLIDTHTHLYLKEFDEDREEVFQRAENVGVKKMLLPNIDSSSVARLKNTCNEFPDFCYPMMGLHPTSVDKEYSSELKKIKEHLDNNQYVAIGEIGIDLYWDKTYQAEQADAFRTQIGWAIDRKLPIVIHARDSFKEIFEVVDDMNCKQLRGVFHCFTGTAEDARKIIDYGGFKMGIGGVLTFKNSKLDEVVKDISLEHLILETDSPYLAPAPHRGKRNESSYVSLVAQKLAETKGLPVEDIAEATTKNAVELFNLDLK